MTILHKLPPLENVGASQTAILPRMPLGMTYHGIVFKLGGTAFTKAQITGIRASLDGKQFVNLSGARLDAINSFDGRTANAAYLTLPFGEANARTIVGEGIGSVQTINRNLFNLEVDIGAATAPTLEAWAILGGPKKDQRYADYIRAYLTTIHTPGGAGEFNLNVPMGSLVGAEVKRVHYFHANVTKLQVLRDGLYMMQEAEIGLLAYMYAELNRVAQAGHTAWDPAWNDDQSDAVPTYRADGNPAVFEHKVTVSAADTVAAVTDLYAPSIAHV